VRREKKEGKGRKGKRGRGRRRKDQLCPYLSTLATLVIVFGFR